MAWLKTLHVGTVHTVLVIHVFFSQRASSLEEVWCNLDE
jgi:hypothetical protein